MTKNKYSSMNDRISKMCGKDYAMAMTLQQCAYDGGLLLKNLGLQTDEVVSLDVVKEKGGIEKYFTSQWGRVWDGRQKKIRSACCKSI